MNLEIILAVLIGTLLWWAYFKKPSGLPPGEWGWPILGFVPKKGERLITMVRKLREKHGDIFVLKLGQKLTVFLCDYSTTKSVFSKANFSGRPDYYTFLIFRKGVKSGIMMSDKALWTSTRRFSLRVLRDFGMGRFHIGDVIGAEVQCVVDFLMSSNGNPIRIDWCLNVAVVNIIMQLTSGIRHDIDDPKIIEFTSSMNQMFYHMAGPLQGFNFYPWLQYLVPSFYKNNFMHLASINEILEKLYTHFEEIINDHRETLNPTNPRDYIDAYLIEMEKEKGSHPDVNHHHLLCSLIDLFVAGSDTVSSSIRWYCLYMAKHPEIQKKVHAELDSVVSPGRFPNIDEKMKLPYFEASIYDLLRVSSLVPGSVLHQSFEDEMIDQFKIPKESIIMPMVELHHKDPKYWRKPEEFYPEHFINENGAFFIQEKGFLPFGTGKRQCLGESLAKSNLYLFLGAIMTTFEIKEPENQSITLDPEPNVHFLNLPQSQDLKFILRK